MFAIYVANMFQVYEYIVLRLILQSDHKRSSIQKLHVAFIVPFHQRFLSDIT